MEDLSKLTRDEARERLKQAGVGSTLKHRFHLVMLPSLIYTITGFDAFGDPQVETSAEDLHINTSTLFWANDVILVKAANGQVAETPKE